MRVHRNNRPLFSLSPSHPVIKFFDACSRIPWPDGWPQGTDQEWDSIAEGRGCTLSSFVYEHLCFDIVLEGWLTRPPTLASDEVGLLDKTLPRMRMQLSECEAAAMRDGNTAALAVISDINSALNRWEDAIRFRIAEDHLSA
jgi:hypothetical protein